MNARMKTTIVTIMQSAQTPMGDTLANATRDTRAMENDAKVCLFTVDGTLLSVLFFEQNDFPILTPLIHRLSSTPTFSKEK